MTGSEGDEPREERGVLDTSTVVCLGSISPSQLPREGLITAITLAELTVGPLAAGDGRERAVRQERLQAVENSFDPLPFDAASARAFGRVADDLRRQGRKSAARAYDALIAATALARGLPVYTCNDAEFSGIKGLEVREVFPEPRTDDRA